MNYFELCSTNKGALRTSGLLPNSAYYAVMTSVAEAYRVGGDAFADRVNTYDGGKTKSTAEAIQELYKISTNVDPNIISRATDAAFSIAGQPYLNVDGVSAEDRAKTMNSLGASLGSSFATIADQAKNDNNVEANIRIAASRYVSETLAQLVAEGATHDLSPVDIQAVADGFVRGSANPFTNKKSLTKISAESILSAIGMVQNAPKPKFETEDSVDVSGNTTGERAQSYEEVNRANGGNATEEERTFDSIENGKTVKRTADDVLTKGGTRTAVDMKYTDAWASSAYNPKNFLNAGMNNKIIKDMIAQARAYENNFGRGALYKTNSPELVNYYIQVFNAAGIKNFKFVIVGVR